MGITRERRGLRRRGEKSRVGIWTAARDFIRDESGSYLVYFTLLTPVLVGVAGLAGEGSLLFYNHRALQSAADGAAYSAAIAYSYSTAADIDTQAQAVVASYGFALGAGADQADVSATATTFAGQPAIRVAISRPQTAIFSKLAGFPSLSNTVRATAVLSSSNSGNCLLALGETSTGNNAANAISITGNSTTNLGGCGVFSNSTGGGVCPGSCASSSISLTGNITLDAGSIGTAGCLSSTGNVTIGPPPKAYTQCDGPLSDPYASLSIPSTGSNGSCTPPTGSSGNISPVCTPGVYPHGISFTGNIGSLTLQSGVYILQGALKLTGNISNVVGNGVTLVFTSATPGNSSSYANPMLSIPGNSQLTLTAPTTGATAGLVIVGDRTMPLGTAFNITGNSSTNLSGTVYLPRGALNWTGNSATTTNCRQFIVNTFQSTGNVSLSNNGCNLAAGQLPIGSIVTLVQ